MQPNSAREMSASVVDAADAVAAAPVGMLWRGTVDLLKAIYKMKLTIGVDNEREKIETFEVFRNRRQGRNAVFVLSVFPCPIKTVGFKRPHWSMHRGHFCRRMTQDSGR